MSNMKLAVALMCVVACGHLVAAQSGAWVKPKQCKTLDCPRYQVVRTLPGGIELRRYEPSAWVATDSYAMTMQGGNSFMTLFQYIDGANNAKKKVPMTAPVLTRVVPGEGPFCKNNFTMGFYLPYALQGAAAAVPTPATRAAYIKRKPAMEVYVLSFGGVAGDATNRAKATELMTKLRAANVKYDPKAWWTAGYNSPYELLDRHNEVWVAKA